MGYKFRVVPGSIDFHGTDSKNAIEKGLFDLDGANTADIHFGTLLTEQTFLEQDFFFHNSQLGGFTLQKPPQQDQDTEPESGDEDNGKYKPDRIVAKHHGVGGIEFVHLVSWLLIDGNIFTLRAIAEQIADDSTQNTDGCTFCRWA